jgi:hypothetical protein
MRCPAIGIFRMALSGADPVPDIYSIRVGGAAAIAGVRGLSANLGIRLDGIPVSDLIGGSSGFSGLVIACTSIQV